MKLPLIFQIRLEMSWNRIVLINKSIVLPVSSVAYRQVLQQVASVVVVHVLKLIVAYCPDVLHEEHSALLVHPLIDLIYPVNFHNTLKITNTDRLVINQTAKPCLSSRDLIKRCNSGYIC